MRGKPVGDHEVHIWARNIPAYAGKTARLVRKARLLLEHPRVCGENSTSLGIFFSFFGTSPRMRGKLRQWVTPPCLGRNIPAYAGKTSACAPHYQRNAEHPRVCGENMRRIWPVSKQLGTSPRMRGKPSDCSPNHRTTRNIPAYAGKTAGLLRCPRPDTEHPRVCGENASVNSVADPISGTSPRMRGKPSGFPGPALRTRNIPAYAGKTLPGWMP